MKLRTVSGIMLTLLLIAMLTLAFNVGAVDDLEVEMTVSNTTITIGEWINITLTLRNIGTSNVTITFTPPLFDVYYCTPHGCFKYTDGKVFPLYVVFITLEPGQNYTETPEWNLYQYVNGTLYPPEPGIYYLWGICYWENITTSSPIPVTLIEQVIPVGGIYIPVNKLELLAPYIGLTILIAVAVIAVGYVKKRKRNRIIS